MSTMLETPTEERTQYWSEESNRKRSEALKGRTMSFDRRAQMYASHKTGKRAHDNDPEWIAEYRSRLSDLRMQEHIRTLVARGELGGKPLKAKLTTQLGKVMSRVTISRIDPEKLEEELASRRMTFETLNALSQWAGLSQQEIIEVVEGRAESVLGK